MSRRRRRDEGAAAVEFALLFPIFAMITFGVLTAGVAAWHYIAMTQGARDAARYGSTLPIDASGSTSCTPPVPTSGTLGIGCWLYSVREVAAVSAGWPSGTNVSDGDGYVCVAFVSGGSGGMSDRTLTSGTPRAGDVSSGTTPCFTDNLTGPRVQVVVRRDSTFNAVLLADDWELRSRSVLPYERDTT